MLLRVLIGWLAVAVLLSPLMSPELRVLCRGVAILALLGGVFAVGLHAGTAARQRRNDQPAETPSTRVTSNAMYPAHWTDPER